MSLEAERAAEAREWMSKVAADLRGERVDLSAEPPLVEDALFHCPCAGGESAPPGGEYAPRGWVGELT